MLIPVLIVSSLVHIYSIGYMSHDPRGRVRGKRVYGGKLSNSGELLKLKVPNCSWKIICGWSNYSDKVTTLKICENKMDNRGSKSVVRYYSATVKEQRVNVYRYLQDPPLGESTLEGWIFVIYLRCILMSLVISYD